MTMEIARQIAEEFAVKAGLAISRFDSAHFFPHFAGKTDEWVVRFEAELPNDVVSGPELILIIVDDKTGQASSFNAL